MKNRCNFGLHWGRWCIALHNCKTLGWLMRQKARRLALANANCSLTAVVLLALLPCIFTSKERGVARLALVLTVHCQLTMAGCCVGRRAESRVWRLLCTAHRGSQVPVCSLLVDRIGIAAAREAAGCYDRLHGCSTNRKDHTRSGGTERHVCSTQTQTRVQSQTGSCYSVHVLQLGAFSSITCLLYTGGNLADTGSLELPQWNPPASWSLP